MDGRTVAAVALRVWGVIVLLDAVAAVPQALLAVRAGSWHGEQMAQAFHTAQVQFLFQLAASAILGLCLLIWAEGIARRVIPETAPLQLGVDASQLLSIGVALVGLFTLIRGLETGVGLAYVLATKPKWVDGGATSYLWDSAPERVAQAVSNVMLGVILTLGRSGFGRAWAQLRSLARTGHGLTR